MADCLKCSGKAVISIPYSGSDLCETHFIEFVERRVRKEVKQQGTLPKKSIIALGVSGGKDSMSMLSIMSEIFGKNRNISLRVIFIDEGIHGYRGKALKVVSKFCEKIEIPLYTFSFSEEFGFEMDKIAALGGDWRPCAYCGVLRRYLLNKKSREVGATKIAVGHNLDDMSQSIIMNIVNGDVQRLVRLGPHSKVQAGLVPRMLPLRTIPEAEVKLYAELKGIPHIRKHCPYRPMAHRLGFLEIINSLEEENPGTKHSILSSYDQMIPALRDYFPQASLNSCMECGEPTMGRVCKACEMLDKVKNALAHST